MMIKIEQLNANNIFSWEGGIEGNTTSDSAISEILNHIPEQDRLDIAKNITDSMVLMETLFKERFAAEGFTPIYHEATHAKWTMVHALRIMLGDMGYDRDSFKLITNATLFHELDDWWNKTNDEELLMSIYSEIEELLVKQAVDITDFCRVIAIDEFATPLNKRCDEVLKSNSHVGILPSSRDLAVYNQSSFEYFKRLGIYLRGADLAQCLHSNYLKTISMPVGHDGEEVEVCQGSFYLAVEFQAMRPKALEHFGWGTAEAINWNNVGVSHYFFHNFFAPMFNNVLPMLNKYYEGEENNPYYQNTALLLEQTERTFNKHFNWLAFNALPAQTQS